MNPTPTELDETAAALQASDKMAEYLALTEMLVRTDPMRADIHLHRALERWPLEQTAERKR